MRTNGLNTIFFHTSLFCLFVFAEALVRAAWSPKWRELGPSEFLSFLCARGDPTISSASQFALRKGVRVFHRAVEQLRSCSPWLEGAQRTGQALPKAPLRSPGAAPWGGWWWNTSAVEQGGGDKLISRDLSWVHPTCNTPWEAHHTWLSCQEGDAAARAEHLLHNPHTVLPDSWLENCCQNSFEVKFLLFTKQHLLLMENL